MNTTYLLLGSNLGDSKKYLATAIFEIGKNLGIIAQVSSLYQTAAWGKNDQPDYLNQALKLKTNLSPQVLLSAIMKIETKLGRKRLEKWGSRIIDIDILLYDNLIVDEVQLSIPHPYLAFRRFCLMPLCEIAPNYKHPVFKKTIEHLLLELQDDLSVKKIS